jgi:hypothetical protein
MTYVLTGVEINVPGQAMRPRQAMPPQAHASGARVPRPGPVSASTAARAAALALEVKHKAKQRQLEMQLAQMQGQHTKLQAACRARPNPVCSAALLALQKRIAALVVHIKACAAEAAKAALVAMRYGATQTGVRAAVIVPPPIVPAPIVRTPAAPGIPASTVVFPTSPTTTVVESSTASVGPGGTLVPGPGATVVETPAVSEPGAPVPDVSAPAGMGMGMKLGIGLAVLGGLWFATRKG